MFACNIFSQFSPRETPLKKTQLYNITTPFNLVLYTKHRHYLYRKDEGLPWFPVSEIKDFVKDLEKGTMRKNTRSTASVCFLEEVENCLPLTPFLGLKSFQKSWINNVQIVNLSFSNQVRDILLFISFSMYAAGTLQFPHCGIINRIKYLINYLIYGSWDV